MLPLREWSRVLGSLVAEEGKYLHFQKARVLKSSYLSVNKNIPSIFHINSSILHKFYMYPIFSLCSLNLNTIIQIFPSLIGFAWHGFACGPGF